MKFKFKLQKILDYRKTIRNEKLSFLAEQVQKLNIMNEDRIQIDEEIIENKKKYNIGSKNKNLAHLEWVDQYLRALHLKKKQVLEKISEQETVVESFRQDMSQSNRDFKVMEKLKESQQEKFEYFEKKKEEKELDELNILRQKKRL